MQCYIIITPKSPSEEDEDVEETIFEKQYVVPYDYLVDYDCKMITEEILKRIEYREKS